jgi:protein involved in polysaccharide export with SLBB domain
MPKYFSLLVVTIAALTHQAQADPKISLAAGDRLIIDVVGFSDLSGDYAVRSGDILKLSNGIEISTKGMSVEEFEASAAKSLSARFGGNPAFVVRSVTWRPVYVYGEVATPSAIPFAPGLTPIKAVVLVGGFRSAPSNDLSAFLANENANRDLSTAGITVETLLAREARLTAAQTGADSVEFPAALAVRQREPEIADLIETEKDVFASWRQRLAASEASFAARADNYTFQLQALEENRSNLKAAEKLAAQEVAASESLSKQGLQILSRLNDAKRDRLNSLAQISANLALEADAKAKLEEVRQALAEAGLRSRGEISAELTQVREAIRLARGQLRSSAAIASETGGVTSGALAIGRDGEGARFDVVRDGADLSLTKDGFLMPGDVLRVSASAPAQSGSSQ